MAMAGIGVANLAVLAAILFGGGSAVNMGVPLPPDAGLQSAAPAECLLYAAHYGAAVPSAASTNHVERLLAEPEVQGFSVELTRLAKAALAKMPAADEPMRTVAATLPILAETLLARPSMLYVSSVDLPPAEPSAHAGYVVAAGENVGRVRTALLAWEALYLKELGGDRKVETSQSGTAELRSLPLPVPGPPLVWGVDGEYVFIAAGDGEAADLVQRLKAENPPPAWLTQLHADADVPRTGEVLFVNVAGLMKLADPFIEQAGKFGAPFDLRRALDTWGVTQLRYAAIVAGLNDSTAVSKFIVGHEENAHGVLSLLDATPLTAVDFAAVPRSADAAVVARVDADEVYRRIYDMVKSVDVLAAEAWDDGVLEAERDLKFRIEEDLLAAFGNLWTVYDAPTEGGSLFTGLCVVAAIRDEAKAAAVVEKILKVVEAENSRGDRKPFVISETTVGERTISYIQFIDGPVPVAPAWCIDGGRLIVAMSPQMVRVHLLREADAETLADVPEVARQLKSGDVTALAFVDGRAGAASAYSYLQYGAMMGAGALAKETGILADLGKLPSFAAIRPHLQPSVAVVRRRATTFLFESHAVGPSFSTALPAAAIGVSLVVPAVGAARSQAREINATNNMRRLAIAAAAYAVDNGKPLPRTIDLADGKPALSWRVALLQYLDEKALFDEFHLNEPWDSEHNRKLLDRMPAAFAHSELQDEAGAGRTVLQIPRGEGTLYDSEKPLTDADVDRLPIGRGQTILFVETTAAHAVPWTKPDDVELTPATLSERLHLSPDREFQAAMNDGSVLRLPILMDREILESMFFPRSQR